VVAIKSSIRDCYVVAHSDGHERCRSSAMKRETSSSSSSCCQYRTLWPSCLVTVMLLRQRAMMIYKPVASRFFGLGVSSTNRVSRFNESGRIKYRTLLPRMLSVSRLTGLRPLSVIFTVFKCVFMLISTPNASNCTTPERERERERE
jgi:hypothetical protein